MMQYKNEWPSGQSGGPEACRGVRTALSRWGSPQGCSCDKMMSIATVPRPRKASVITFIIAYIFQPIFAQLEGMR